MTSRERGIVRGTGQGNDRKHTHVGGVTTLCLEIPTFMGFCFVQMLERRDGRGDAIITTCERLGVNLTD